VAETRAEIVVKQEERSEERADETV
jgi:hypothetical protein